jgi:hypothetical protein
MFILFSIPAGYALNELLLRIKSKSAKYVIIGVISIALLINLGTVYGAAASLTHKSEVSQLKSYINSNVGQDDLIVFDSRIYTATSYWMALPHHLLPVSYFTGFYEYNKNISEAYKKPTKVYFVECLIDDCGWGTISQNPQLNESMENFFKQLETLSKTKEVMTRRVYSGNELLSKETEIGYFAVYEITLNLNPATVAQTDEINSFYFAPYLYKNMDKYSFNYMPDAPSEIVLDSLARKVIFIAIALSFLSFIYIIYLVFFRSLNQKNLQPKEETHSPH